MSMLSEGYEGLRMNRGQSPDPTDVEGSSLHGRLLVAASVLIGVGVVMSYSTTAPLSLSHRIPPLFLKHLSSLTIGGQTASTRRRPFPDSPICGISFFPR